MACSMAREHSRDQRGTNKAKQLGRFEGDKRCAGRDSMLSCLGLGPHGENLSKKDAGAECRMAKAESRQQRDRESPDPCARAVHGVGHSITSSARASSDGGIVRPSAFAVLRLMTRSNFVGCSTGKSAGLAPLRILSTYVAARRNKEERLAP